MITAEAEETIEEQEEVKEFTGKEKELINDWAGFFSYEPTWIFGQFLQRHEKIIFIVSGNQYGKCLKIGTDILLDNGLYKKIEHINSGDIILSVNSKLKIVPSKVLSRIDSGHKRLVKIITRRGRTISVSGDHPFLTVHGWRNVEDIQVGDYIATPRNIDVVDGSGDKDQWEYILLGYLLGDGGLTKSVLITNTDAIILNEIRSLLKDGHSLKQTQDKITYKITSHGKGMGNNYYANWLRALNLFGSNSFSKFVPDFIFTSTKKSIGTFLSRLFSCDGWVDNSGVGYCSVSKQLITDVHRLLLRFGITTTIRFKNVKYVYKGIRQKKFAYQLQISRYDDLVKFASYVGIFSKEEKLAKLIDKKRLKESKENADIIPLNIGYLYDEIGEKKNKHDKRRKYSNKEKYDLCRSSRGKSITRSKLKEIAVLFSDEHLKSLSVSDIYWDKIINMEDDGTAQTFDLEIEGTHNFIANDIFAHNTSTVAYSYVLRILGKHPVEIKNMRPGKKVRTYRFASQALPNDPEGGEIKNTQYPAFKKWLPPYLIKRDITTRSAVMVIRDPQGGPDIYIEFVSYSQDIQRMAGQQRASVWLDESANKEFYEEQLPRLLAADGDLIATLTPAEYIGYEYDTFYERAKVIIRTKAVRDRFKSRFNKTLASIETTDSKEDIAVLMAATDDNPIYKHLVKEKNEYTKALIESGKHPYTKSITQFKPTTVNEYISDIIGSFDDETTDIRRYGIFRQSSGQIFKDFDLRTHVLSSAKYFDLGIPSIWLHARGIDYHQHNPWACGFLALSPQNEVFIYEEYNPSPERMVTLQIARELAIRSRDYKYALSLIDPNAAQKQSNTGLRVVDDLNRIFGELKRERIGTGAYWQSWDTKATTGRDRIRERLKNSRLCGTPYNNRIVKDGRTEYLPTIWILDNCIQTIASFKNWRREEWANRTSLLVNDEKDKPQQKWSHFPMVVEAILKHPAFSSGRYKEQFVADRDIQHKHYFQREAYGR